MQNLRDAQSTNGLTSPLSINNMSHSQGTARGYSLPCKTDLCCVPHKTTQAQKILNFSKGDILDLAQKSQVIISVTT